MIMIHQSKYMNYSRYIILLSIVCFIFNYNHTLVYYQKYVPDNFSQSKLFNKKYLCIKYFENNEFDEFTENICKNYKYDYLLFQLQKVIHTNDYVLYNIFCIIILLPILFN
jgi:hypothetical protein